MAGRLEIRSALGQPRRACASSPGLVPPGVSNRRGGGRPPDTETLGTPLELSPPSPAPLPPPVRPLALSSTAHPASLPHHPRLRHQRGGRREDQQRTKCRRKCTYRTNVSSEGRHVLPRRPKGASSGRDAAVRRVRHGPVFPPPCSSSYPPSPPPPRRGNTLRHTAPTGLPPPSPARRVANAVRHLDGKKSLQVGV